MKPEYQQIRFLVQAVDQLPARFGVVTACNPNGITVSDEQNRAATDRLRIHLVNEGLEFFPATGCSPDLRHQEPGLRVVYDNSAVIVELGRAWQQEAVFLVEDGIVRLVPCGEGEPITLGRWQDFQSK